MHTVYSFNMANAFLNEKIFVYWLILGCRSNSIETIRFSNELILFIRKQMNANAIFLFFWTMLNKFIVHTVTI